MTISDALHYTPEQRAAIIAGYPSHEREARANGIPTLGSGRVFPVVEDAIRELPITIPKHWPRICGIDFGWDHPTAAVWIAWDRDTDTVHVYDCYRVKEATPAIHSLAIKAKGAWIPVAWPHDGLQHDKGSGEQLAEQYRAYGVNMLKDKATHPPAPGEPEGSGGNGVEAGLMDMLDRMQTGRLKVAKHLHDWWEEFRLYHRKDGKIVKDNDDLMCLHPDTVVLTGDGPARLADLVGTEGSVLTVNGELVMYRNCRKTRTDADVVTVLFDDGYELTCTPDHRLLTAEGEWVEARHAEGVFFHNAVSHSALKEIISARTLVSPAGAGMRGSTTSIAFVPSVAQHLAPTAFDQPKPAQKVAGVASGLRPRKGSNTSKILRVRSAGKSDTYCLEVPSTNAFAVGNGVVVHNCATRYGVMMLRKAVVNNPPNPIPRIAPPRHRDPGLGALGYD
jgi:hypothetical protein